MSWQCHMLAYQPPYDRQKILNVLNTMPDVVNWRASTGAIFIVTPITVPSHSIAQPLIHQLPDLRFVVAAVNGFAAQGSTDQGTWDFINHPAPAQASAPQANPQGGIFGFGLPKR